MYHVLDCPEAPDSTTYTTRQTTDYISEIQSGFFDIPAGDDLPINWTNFTQNSDRYFETMSRTSQSVANGIQHLRGQLSACSYENKESVLKRQIFQLTRWYYYYTLLTQRIHQLLLFANYTL